jgi:hypothetical protein
VFPFLDPTGQGPVREEYDPRNKDHGSVAAHRNIDNDPRVLRFIFEEIKPFILPQKRSDYLQIEQNSRYVTI